MNAALPASLMEPRGLALPGVVCWWALIVVFMELGLCWRLAAIGDGYYETFGTMHDVAIPGQNPSGIKIAYPYMNRSFMAE